MSKLVEKEIYVKIFPEKYIFNNSDNLSNNAKIVIEHINASICFANNASNKKIDNIFLTSKDICQITSLNKRKVLNAIKELQSKDILSKTENGIISGKKLFEGGYK